MMRVIPLFVALFAAVAAQTSGLRIVVIEGEDAVNVIQQKTAVSPIVEVRDRNNQPVAGAIVTFSVQGGKNAVFAGGSQTLTVTTNAAGRAAASALSPLSSGGVQIQVQAAFQGQTVAATIAQTNVMTAAEAAGASSASGASGAGAGGGGGGVSGLAIAGIVTGGLGAGALVAVRQLSGDDANDPATLAAVGTYILQQIDGAGLPARTIDSPPNPCPGFTDSGTMKLSADGSFEFSEFSHIECSLGGGNSFNATKRGKWTIAGGTITFTETANDLNFGPGALNGSTLTFAFDAPHANAGNPGKRVNSVWRK